jgi:tetratricopeptide (TPR) repeat protein
MRIRPLVLAATLALGLTQTGCIKKVLIAGQASSTRTAAKAMDGVADPDVARTAQLNALAQSEGLHYLSPNNLDVLYLLTRGWTSYGFGFAQDDMERAEEGSETYEEAKRLANHAFEKAVKYGNELLSHRDEGYAAAFRNDATLKAWLKEHYEDKEDADELFWIGYGRVARVNLLRDQPEMVAELWIGIAMVEHSFALDPDYNNSVAQTALAAYHARAAVAELDEAKRMFEEVLRKTQRKVLLVQVNYALRYACIRQDRDLYESLLDEVLKFDDTSAPHVRLGNAMSKRKARRFINDKKFMTACGFDMSKPSKLQNKSNLDSGEVSPDDFLKPSGATSSPPASSAPPVAPPASASPPAAPSASAAPPASAASSAPPAAAPKRGGAAPR